MGDLTDLVDGSVLWPGDYFANGKDLQKFLRNDSNLIFQNLPNVTKSSDTLTVGGISQKCTLLEVQISGQDFVHILLALKDELGSDQEVRSLMQAFAEDCAAVFPYDAPSLSDLSRIFQTFLAALEDEAREISSSADARTAC